MSFQRYDNGGNNKFPLTNYGTDSLRALAKYGASIGTDTQDIIKYEIVVRAGDTVTKEEFNSTIVSVIPKGYFLQEVAVFPVETFNGLINIGVADKATGVTVDDPLGLYTGTPTVGTPETSRPTLGVLEEDLFITVDATLTTVGLAKVVITLRNAIADID